MHLVCCCSEVTIALPETCQSWPAQGMHHRFYNETTQIGLVMPLWPFNLQLQHYMHTAVEWQMSNTCSNTAIACMWLQMQSRHDGATLKVLVQVKFR